jgi:hypothetical protein
MSIVDTHVTIVEVVYNTSLELLQEQSAYVH